jgi:hypothetical protein
VILDGKGNIFGGFTPIEWESWAHNGKWRNKNNCLKPDDNVKSFLFTLKNSHNIPARTFALKAEKKHDAILFILNAVQALEVVQILVFSMTTTQTPAVPLTLATLTPMTQDWPG